MEPVERKGLNSMVFPSRKHWKPAKIPFHHAKTAAHNPKVVGSNPASATKKPLKSQNFSGFSLFFSIFVFGLFRENFF